MGKTRKPPPGSSEVDRGRETTREGDVIGGVSRTDSENQWLVRVIRAEGKDEVRRGQEGDERGVNKCTEGSQPQQRRRCIACLCKDKVSQ